MQEKNTSDKIMQEIKSGELKIRSKFSILTEKIGIGSMFLLGLLISIFVLALLFYYLKSSENLFYLRFGWPGLAPFLESFPYLYLLISIPVILFLAWLFKKKKWLYKYPFKYIALFLLIFVLLTSSVFAFSGVVEKIEEHVFRNKNFNFISKPKIFEGNRNGMAGIILEKGEGYLILQTPIGEERVEVRLELDEFEIGDFALMIGERQGNEFIVRQIMIHPTSSMPLMQRNIRSKFFPGVNSPRKPFGPEFRLMK